LGAANNLNSSDRHNCYSVIRLFRLSEGTPSASFSIRSERFLAFVRNQRQERWRLLKKTVKFSSHGIRTNQLIKTARELTTKSPAQQSRNRKNRNISRKDAKARSKTFLISPSDTSPWVGMMAFDPSLNVLATWRENIRSESLRLLQNFARGAKIMKQSSTEVRI
jgi:hypothetical protein